MSFWRQITGLFKSGLFLAILIIVLLLIVFSGPKMPSFIREKTLPAWTKKARQKLDEMLMTFVPVKIISVQGQVPPEVADFLNHKLDEIARLTAIVPLANLQSILPGKFCDLGEPHQDGVAWRFANQKGWYVKGDGAWTNPACSEGIRVAQATRPDSPDEPCLEIDCRQAKANSAGLAFEGWGAYPGQRFTISAWVKASEPNQTITMLLGWGRPYGQPFQSQTNWTLHSQTFYVARDIKPVGVSAVINFPRGAVYWIRDFAVARGDNPAESVLTPLQEISREVRQLIAQGNFVQAWRLLSGWRINEALAAARGALSHPAWIVMGPFDNTNGQGYPTIYEPETQILGNLLTPEYRAPDGKTLSWISAYGYEDGGNQGVVDLSRYFDRDENWTIYALTQPVTLKETKCRLALKANGGLKVWLNGRPVYRQAQAPGLEAKPAMIPVILKAGFNLLFLKLAHSAGQPVFTAGFTDEGGRPLSLIRLEPPY